MAAAPDRMETPRPETRDGRGTSARPHGGVAAARWEPVTAIRAFGGGLTGCPRSSGNRGRRQAAHRGGFRSILRPLHVRAPPPCRRPAPTGWGAHRSPLLLGTEPAIEVVAKAGERL